MRAGHRLGLLRRERPAELFVLPELRKKGCDRMIEFVVIFMTLIMGVCLVAAATVLATPDSLCELARTRRKLKTPPCDLCAHHEMRGALHQCKCPAFLDFASRKNGLAVNGALIGAVRGTKQCIFEPKEGGE